jgi:hypothetical protein
MEHHLGQPMPNAKTGAAKQIAAVPRPIARNRVHMEGNAGCGIFGQLPRRIGIQIKIGGKITDRVVNPTEAQSIAVLARNSRKI